MIPVGAETVVRERLGLDPAALGPNALSRAIDARMLARGLTDPGTYAVRLMAEPVERDALAAELAVSETWFFRGGRGLFDRLAAFVSERRDTRGGPVRILSAPCSTGEEPYSLAIALHERFLAPQEYVIDAVDLSDRALARAAAARYGTFAFREAGVDLRPVYFRSVEEGWELLQHLRGAVRYRLANLTDPYFLAGERPYDLIICRNVFMYFTPDARVRAGANLDRLLALDGRLCVTPAEADRLPPARFALDGPTEFGIYRRSGVGSGTHKALTTVDDTPPAPTATPVPAAVPRAEGAVGGARLLADAGRLDEARLACEQQLRTCPTDVDALTLLGVVHLASGRASAAFDSFRKALYLAPDHVEAIEHMMALCERRGDKSRAAALRRRLARLAPQEGP